MAPQDPQLHLKVGHIEGRVDAIDSRQERMEEKVDEIHAWMQQARGGWKTMVAWGVIGAGLTAALANIGTAFAWLRGSH